MFFLRGGGGKQKQRCGRQTREEEAGEKEAQAGEEEEGACCGRGASFTERWQGACVISSLRGPDSAHPTLLSHMASLCSQQSPTDKGNPGACGPQKDKIMCRL